MNKIGKLNRTQQNSTKLISQNNVEVLNERCLQLQRDI